MLFKVLFSKIIFFLVFLQSFFIWNHPTLIVLTRNLVIFIPVFFFFFLNSDLEGKLGNYQPMRLCYLWFSLSYWVRHVDQYSEIGSQISCCLTLTLKTTGYSYYSGDLQTDFKLMRYYIMHCYLKLLKNTLFDKSQLLWSSIWYNHIVT